MNATPLNMPNRKATQATVTAEVVYTTSTGDAPRPAHTPIRPAYGMDPYEETAFCFVCSRCTEHVGEHEALVEAGLATYEGGSVYKTAAYDADLAREIQQAEFARLYPQFAA